MALKIIPPGNPIQVDNVIVTIYGTPGSGKTSLAYTAKDVVVLDFDRGSHRTPNQNLGMTWGITAWNDLRDIGTTDLKPFRTVVIDTVGAMVDSMIAYVEISNPQKARNPMLLYGEVGKIYKAFIAKIKSCGLDLVFIAHYVEEKNGDKITVRLEAGGKAKHDVMRSSDIIGFLEHTGNTRVLSFDPVDGRIAKNSGNFAPINLTETPTTLAEIIVTLKTRLNAVSESYVKAQEDKAVAIELIGMANSADQFNGLMTNEAILANKELKLELLKTAKNLGIEFDRENKCFIAPIAELVSDDPFNEDKPSVNKFDDI